MSWVHAYVKRGSVTAQTKTVCTYVSPSGVRCPAEFSATTSTNTLASHLLKMHKLSPPDAQTAKKQKTAESFAVRENEDVQLNPMEFVCALWARCGLSYQLVEDVMFRRQFSCTYPVGLNRHRLSEEMITLADKVDGLIGAQMKGNAVTVCMDGWTHFRDKYVDLLAVCRGKSYFLTSVRVLRNSEEQLRPILDSAHRTLRAWGAVLVAVCADNARGGLNAIEAFTSDNRAVVGFRCQAHSLQLAVWDILRLEPAAMYSDAAEKYMEFFADAERRRAIEEAQQTEVAVNRCIKPTVALNKTRWSSMYLLLKEIVQLQKYFDAVGFILTADELSGVHFLLELLKPFYDQTQLMQGDSCDVMHAAESWKILSQHLKEMKTKQADGARKRVCVAAQEILDERGECHLRTNEDFVMLQFLSGPAAMARKDKQKGAEKTLAAARYVWEELGHPATSVHTMAGQLDKELAEFISNNEGPAPDLWISSARACAHPLLYKIATMYLSIHPTEACVERAFSAQGLLHSDLRAGLSLRSVVALMKVRMNLRTLQA